MSISLQVLLACFALMSDWDRFRGPNGSGVNEAQGLPAEFNAEKNMRWRVELPPGHSSPILVGDRIFLTAFQGEKLLTFSLDRETGKILWRREAPKARSEKFDKRNSPASPSPATDGKNIYVFFGEYGMVSYGFDGNERWRVPLGPFNNVYGMGASPVVVDDKVVLVCDQSEGSFIAAYGLADGKQRWKTTRPEALSGHSTPSIIKSGDGKSLIVAPASFRMDVYSADTGQSVWWMHGLASEMKSVPVIDGDTIYINGYNTPENDPGKQIAIAPFEDVVKSNDKNGDGQISIDEAPDQRTKTYFPYIDLNGDGKLDAYEWKMYAAIMGATNSLMAIKLGTLHGDVSATAVEWKFHKSIPQLPSVVSYRGVIYMINDSGVLTTLDAKTGEVFKQARLRSVSDKYYASPVASDGKIFFAAESGTIAVVKAGRDQELLAVNKVDEDIHATPAIADGRIYVRTALFLYCFGER
jgi:outer membrane protein assembly factor BamB